MLVAKLKNIKVYFLQCTEVIKKVLLKKNITLIRYIIIITTKFT